MEQLELFKPEEMMKPLLKPLLKQCDPRFHRYIEYVRLQLPPDERQWINDKVRFTQKHPLIRLKREVEMHLNFLEMGAGLIREKEHTQKKEDCQKLIEFAEFHLETPLGQAWKHGRFHYVRVHPKLLRYPAEEIIFTIAHELGHCFTWTPLKKGPIDEKIREDQADKWASERGFEKDPAIAE